MTDQEQSLVSHLVELRGRLLKAVLSVLILVVVMFPFAGEIYTIVAKPVMDNLSQGTAMIATGVLSPFLTPFKMVIILAIIISMPVIIYQIWAFVAPGLYKREKRVAMPILISSIILFYMGCAFAFFVVFPILFVFLPSIAPEGVTYMPDINSYLDIVVRLFFAFGLAFEIPVAVIILISLGVTSAEKLANARPYVIIGILVVAMLLTPPDPSSQVLLAIPMWILFEFGIMMGKILRKKNQKNKAASDQEGA
ncbi:twin-arginine translocase subunit TatC [Marinicella sp. S1101]|uniref:twin-arginine translocase subunit TatC n=1 Tax=Marinicella marina TaxID=2996016 RepID=UPI002260FF98|nr:twin-arginine translocase subunit TatC [Marinicella marina]MCX7552677.1 twin-arginine translocase subunit TatC [Marinicella marina]MDJ1139553.1 twin-arginine translocase subunit TatC [Marinicella marina]